VSYHHSIQTPFGLAIWNTTLLVSDWGRKAIISYDTVSKTQMTIMSRIAGPVGLFYSVRSRVITGRQYCALQVGDI